MPLPSLPLDVWFRIATFMDGTSLSALSEVSQSLHNIAMDKTHFQRLLPVPQTQHTHLLQLYRRMSALHHPPDKFFTATLLTDLRMVCVAHDTLLFVDVEKKTFVAFPSGLTIAADHILGVSQSKILNFMLNNVEDRILALPDRQIGFLCGAGSRRLAVLDLNTGEVFSRKLRRRRKPNMTIVHGKALLVAGNNAEWILYRVDETTVEIRDWRTGDVVRAIDLASDDIKFVIGECPAIDGSSVVGVAVTKKNGSVNEIRVKGFDDVEMTFRVDEDKMVNSILRSADKKTHALIIGSGQLGLRPTAFIAHRNYAGSEKWWSGPFNYGGMLYPELKENGSVIAATRNPFLKQPRFGCRCCAISACQLWVELKKDEAKWCTTEATSVQALKGRTPPVWSRRLREGGLAVMARRKEGVIDLVEFVRDGTSFKENLLKSWTIKNLTNLCVVADHFIVVSSSTGDDQQLHLLHFDKFCCGAGGVYACPLIGLWTYCNFPEVIHEREPSSPRKRRRISDGPVQVSVV